MGNWPCWKGKRVKVVESTQNRLKNEIDLIDKQMKKCINERNEELKSRQNEIDKLNKTVKQIK